MKNLRNITSLQLNVLLAFGAVYIIWGTTYLAIVIGLRSFPPFILASVRYFIAGALLLSYCRIKGEGIFSRSLLTNMVLGAVILTGGQAVLFWAEKYISSGLTAILVSTLPLWFVIIDKSGWKNYFSNKNIIIGLITGFSGIILLFEKAIFHGLLNGSNRYELTAILVTLLSCVFWTAGSLYSKYRSVPGSIFLKLGWQMAGGLVSSLVVSYIFAEQKTFSFTSVSLLSWGAVFYLSVAGSLVAFGSYTWLLKVKQAAVVGSFAYVNPVIAVLIGWLAVDEKVSFFQVLGMVIILSGAYFINKKNNAPKGASKTDIISGLPVSPKLTSPVSTINNKLANG